MRNVILLFAGWNGAKDLGDLWKYDLAAGRWFCLSADCKEAGGPSPRSCHKARGTTTPHPHTHTDAIVPYSHADQQHITLCTHYTDTQHSALRTTHQTLHSRHTRHTTLPHTALTTHTTHNALTYNTDTQQSHIRITSVNSLTPLPGVLRCTARPSLHAWSVRCRGSAGGGGEVRFLALRRRRQRLDRAIA